MNIVAITKHTILVERVRTAFEGAGHTVKSVADPLQALAQEVWNEAQLILVDAKGDPLDGLRFSRLLRGETRLLFHNLPIFLILEDVESELTPSLTRDADVDGFLHADEGLGRILSVLGPALDGVGRKGQARIPVLHCGLSRPLATRIGKVLEHFGFELQACPDKELVRCLDHFEAPLLLMGLDPSGEETLEALQVLREHPSPPYIILVGRFPRQAMQRKLLLSGGMDWIPLPLSHPLLLHACRRGMDWLHMKRIHREYQSQINDLHERRVMLEIEASSLRSEVLTDPLTDLLNRRAFDQNLELALNQWQRHHRAFVLIFGDIDYFKLVNDRFGHLVGDEVLKIVAERLRGSLRRSDLAFRIGGEEFAVILMETSLQAGAEVADKLRRRIDDNPVVLESGQSLFPTISFGVGAPGNLEAGALCAAVDKALYTAKHKGRNRIEVLPEEDEGPTG